MGATARVLVGRVGLPLVVFALWASPAAAQRVQIVLDVSGSMRASAGGTTKIEAARQAVRITVDALDVSSNVALRLYGHRLPADPKEASCSDTELVIPFGPLDRQRFISAVQAAQPHGQTPLAYALEQAAADFGDAPDGTAAVILVSDGEETCGGDPAAVACALAARGLELTVHTVGFDVDPAARAQLQAIASCTGGEYRDARNAAELGESLRQLTEAGLLIDKRRESSAAPQIRGGDGFASAVPITPGSYRLDHHQRRDEYDFFAIEVRPGYSLEVRQVAYEVGVDIAGDTFKEAPPVTSRAGVGISGPDQLRIARHAGLGAGQEAFARAGVTAGRGGTYYIDIGTSYGDVHKDSVMTVAIVDQTDADSGTDAGGSERDALSLEPGVYRAWRQSRDDIDMYAVTAAAGAAYGVRVRPENADSVLSLVVTDDDGVQLARASAPNGGAAARVDGVQATRSGRLLVAVTDFYPSDYVAYSLEVTVEDATESTGTGAPSTRANTGPADDAAGTPVTSGALRGVALGVGAFLLLVVVVGAAIVWLVAKGRRGTAA